MQEWIEQVIRSPEFGVLVVPASLLLGLITAVGSGCNIAMLGAVAGFAGSRQRLSGRLALLTSGFFVLGTVVSLTALGALLGRLSDAATGNVARGGMLVGGIVMVFFGLAALKLAPFELPSLEPLKGKLPRGLPSAALFGLSIGAASVACTLFCCGPLLPFALGLAALRGQTGWGALIMAMFAIGYSFPMAAIILGIGAGRMTAFARRLAEPIRIGSGVLLVVAGFWLLISL